MNAAARTLMIAAGLSLLSCGKGDDAGKTRRELLTAGKWRVTEKKATSTTRFNGRLTVTNLDHYASMADCQRDNLNLYRTAGTFSVDEGATKCSLNDPQTTEEGDWQLVDGEGSIKVTNRASGDYVIYTIEELTESRLRLSGDTTYALGNGNSARIERSETYVSP